MNPKNTMNALFVCTAALQRSPTAAEIFSDIAREKKISVNVKYAGIHMLAIPRVDKELIDWADMIYAMENIHKDFILSIAKNAGKKIKVLNIKDIYFRGAPELKEILRKKLEKEIK